MQKIMMTVAILLLIFSCNNEKNNDVSLEAFRGDIPLEIHIVADSTHEVVVKTSVIHGIPLQKVMQAVVQIGYNDPANSFVNSIVGVTADAAEKEFWFLEINGKASQVGLTQISVEDSMQVVWRLKNY